MSWPGRSQTQLRGRRFQPPRERWFTMHPLIVRILDWWRGRQLGIAFAFGQRVRGEDGRLYVDAEVDAQTQKAQARVRNGYSRVIAATEEAQRDARERMTLAEAQRRSAAERDRELAGREAQFGERNGPNRLQLGSTLTLLFLLTLPIDVGAAQLLPLTTGMQTLLVVTLGGGMVLSADVASRKIEDLREAYERRLEDAFALVQEKTLLAAAIVTPLGVVGGTTLLRSEAFGIAAKSAGRTVPLGPANVAFAFIALMAFVIAILVGLSYRHVKPLRAVRRERRKLDARANELDENVASDGSLERQADVRLQALSARREQALKVLEAWGAERKARIRHHAAVVESRVRRRRRLGPPTSDEQPA